MRYFDLTLTSETGGIHPVDRVLAETTSVTRRAIMHFDALGDGTGVLLYRLEGDPDVVVPDIGDHPDVVAYDMLDAEDEEFHLYLHILPGDPAGALLELTEEHALMIDTPIEFTGRGAVRLTVVGSHEMLQSAMEDLPEAFTYTVEEVGSYTPDRRDTLSDLTERQLEVFRTAVDLGYYDIPREATHEDIASRLEVAPSTVDEHLRKAESQVLQTLVG